MEQLNPYFVDNLQRSTIIKLSDKNSPVSPRSRKIGLSIVVLNLERPDLVEQLLSGFSKAQKEFESAQLNFEVVIGDTGSTNPDVLSLYQHASPDIRIIRDLKYHFSRCNNQLFKLTLYDTVLFLNNDVIIDNDPSVILRAYHQLTDLKYDVLGSVLCFKNGTIQHAGINFLTEPRVFSLPYHPRAGDAYETQQGFTWDTPAVTGAFLMMRSSLFEEIGGFDEVYEAECQDVDLCLKAHRLGGAIGVSDLGPLVHLENATRPKGEENWNDRSVFIRRWSSYVESVI